jgi:hypothetical protein
VTGAPHLLQNAEPAEMALPHLLQKVFPSVIGQMMPAEMIKE